MKKFITSNPSNIIQTKNDKPDFDNIILQQ